MTIFVDGVDMEKAAMSARLAESVHRFGMVNTIMNELQDRALDGQALQFNKAFIYKGEAVMFEPGSFDDQASHSVAFCIDHLPSSEVGSTSNGALELMIDDVALQFRLDLDKASHGHAIARMCQVGSRDAVSIGCDILEQRKENIAGHDVRVVSRARLREISVCSVGAVPTAFAVLVDKTCTSKPIAGQRSSTFNLASAMHGVSRAVKNWKQDVRDAFDDVIPVRRTYTIAESNRWATAEYDRLAALARASRH